jgi:threonine dehydrogenase-like Zn-dependent dehydrogenase
VRDQEGHIRYTILSRRIDFRRGQSVLILGATGNAGRMAVQVARRFGASRVIALGRDAARLEALKALGADETLTFDQVAEAADVDVVIDYLWGEPAFVGSGIGSVPGRDFVRELPKLAGAVADGAFDARARAVPLRDAEQAWTETLGTSDRVVFVP